MEEGLYALFLGGVMVLVYFGGKAIMQWLRDTLTPKSEHEKMIEWARERNKNKPVKTEVDKEFDEKELDAWMKYDRH